MFEFGFGNIAPLSSAFGVWPEPISDWYLKLKEIIEKLNVVIGYLEVWNIPAMDDTIKNLSTSIDTLNTQMADFYKEYETNKGNVKSSINAINTTLSSIQYDISSINGNLVSIRNDVDSNTRSVTDLDGRITTNTSNISSLEGRVSTNESDIAALKNSSSSSEGQITDIQSELNTLSSSISDIINEINTIKENLENALLVSARTISGHGISTFSLPEDGIYLLKLEINKFIGTVGPRMARTQVLLPLVVKNGSCYFDSNGTKSECSLDCEVYTDGLSMYIYDMSLKLYEYESGKKWAVRADVKGVLKENSKDSSTTINVNITECRVYSMNSGQIVTNSIYYGEIDTDTVVKSNTFSLISPGMNAAMLIGEYGISLTTDTSQESGYEVINSTYLQLKGKFDALNEHYEDSSNPGTVTINLRQKSTGKIIRMDVPITISATGSDSRIQVYANPDTTKKTVVSGEIPIEELGITSPIFYTFTQNVMVINFNELSKN